MSGCPISSSLPPSQTAATTVYSRLNADSNLSLHEKALAFLDLLKNEPEGPEVSESRRKEILRDVERHGYYEHTSEELLWGCRFAWRHSVRCIGRFFWKQLEVRDARHISDLEGLAQGCIEHIAAATNGGVIRPLVTVFPAQRAEDEWRIWNYQLLRYAGYRGQDGSVLGDPEEAGFTELCESLGWKSPAQRGRFDVLPLVASAPRACPMVFEIPPSHILEVVLEHPDYQWFKELGLRWYAVPVVSNMVLEIGGLRYTAAPFNGWYMGTEIGARNFADSSRYNLLPEIAEKMGVFEKRPGSLWKDRALVELNRAVLHSYKEAGVRIVDHHTAAELHVRFEQEEIDCGRPVTGRWDWLVPPLSGATTPIWDRSYNPTEYTPNFFKQSMTPKI